MPDRVFENAPLELWQHVPPGQLQIVNRDKLLLIRPSFRRELRLEL